QNALHTLIHQRHLTPSCGGHAPTAERTMGPARMFTESLTPRPELENSQGHQRLSRAPPHQVSFASMSRPHLKLIDWPRGAMTGLHAVQQVPHAITSSARACSESWERNPEDLWTFVYQFFNARAVRPKANGHEEEQET